MFLFFLSSLSSFDILILFLTTRIQSQMKETDLPVSCLKATLVRVSTVLMLVITIFAGQYQKPFLDTTSQNSTFHTTKCLGCLSTVHMLKTTLTPYLRQKGIVFLEWLHFF